MLLPEDVIEQCRRKDRDELARILLHEEIHGALAAAAGAQPNACDAKLTGLVDQAVVDLMAVAGLFLGEDRDDWESFRERIDRDSRFVLSLIPRLELDGLDQVVELGVENLRAGEYRATARLLAGLRGREQCDAAQWRWRMENDVRLTVEWGDGVITRHSGAELDDGRNAAAWVDANSGYMAWYQHGKRDRYDGPAVVSSRSVEWWTSGCRHRDDGPALMVMPGETVRVQARPGAGPLEITGPAQAWFRCDKLHRPDDGPALITGEPSRLVEHWVDGRRKRCAGS